MGSGDLNWSSRYLADQEIGGSPDALVADVHARPHDQGVH
jgi:hypothetical protein